MYFDITFRLQVLESLSLISVLFREAFSHPYISFFHSLVNGFSMTSYSIFLSTLYHHYIGMRIGVRGENKMVSAGTHSANEPAMTSF